VLVGGRGTTDGLFEKIVDEHYAEIHRYIRCVVWRVDETDDLLQRTFVHAFRARRSLPADANVRAWLFAIATRLCRSHLRAVRPRTVAQAPRPERLTDVSRSAQPEGLADARLDAAIRRLPVLERLAFAMRKLHGLDYEAIGASLDYSAESARTHVLEATRKIRRGLTALTDPKRRLRVAARRIGTPAALNCHP
jgi:RNA polymerase sigma factor (sigma-70 family)